MVEKLKGFCTVVFTLFVWNVILALPHMLLWNALMPKLFGTPEIDFGTSIVIMFAYTFLKFFFVTLPMD